MNSLPKRSISQVALFCNASKPSAAQGLRTVTALLRRHKVRYVLADGEKPPKNFADCDMAIALGGDGTMLSAGRVAAVHGIPLLGVNAGDLGFLSAFDLKGFARGFKSIFSGGLEIQDRWMLSVEVRRGGKTIFGPQSAINDCVVRTSEVRAIKLVVSSSGRFVADYIGDGLVVATPTGSTAYALSLGGPVVVPGVDAFTLAPIAPHSLTMRPIVTPASAPISVTVDRKSSTLKPRVVVSLDGQIERALALGDEVRVRGAERTFKLLLPPKRTHYDALRGKLKWGGR